MPRGSIRRLKSAALRSVRPIAIDFGVKSIKILQAGPGDPPSLIGACAAEVPDEIGRDPGRRLEWQLGELPRLLRAGGFKGRKAVCTIPSSQMFCKHMRLPKTDGVSTADLVHAAVPDQLGCHPDALMTRHVEVAEIVKSGGGSKIEVICLAARRDLIERIMAAFQLCKLEPVGMHPECFALIAAFGAMNRRDADAKNTVLYLDIGAGATKVVIAHGSQLVFAKTIHIGGNAMDQLVAKQLRCEPAVAHHRRLGSPTLTREDHELASAAGAGAPESVPMQCEDGVCEIPREFTQEAATATLDFDLTEPLEALTDEIAMCQRYHESIFPGRRVSQAVFVGGEARHLGLCQHIARRLRLKTQTADPLARLARIGKEPCEGVDLTDPQPGWTVPFGLTTGAAEL